ncbi:unnamed protein product, partial [Brassica rapa subsp. trilocularis]
QSTRVSGGVPTEMQLGLLSPLYLRKLFELMGTTYIKLGQFIASAPTFSQPEYVRRFSEPFNKAPPVPFEEVHKNLQEELGRPRDSVYKYVDPTQLASASITQLLTGTILGFLIKLLTCLIDSSISTNQQQEEKEEEFLRIKDVRAGEEDAATSDKINEQRSRLTNLI